jgi:hypothetical protein
MQNIQYQGTFFSGFAFIAATAWQRIGNFIFCLAYALYITELNSGVVIMNCMTNPYLLFVLLCSTMVIAQTDDNWENYFDDVWKGEFHPMLEGNIGLTQPKYKDFGASFRQIGHAELKLGYSEFRQYKAYIWQLDDRYLFSTYLHPDLDFSNEKIEEGEVSVVATRFGLGNRLGYGYALGPVALVPYNANALTFTRLSFTGTEELDHNYKTRLSRYTNAYEFGMSTEAGVKAKLFKSLSADAAYEWSVTYPVVIFPQWFGSFLVMHTGMSLISIFSQDIIRNSPLLGPMIYFALKNGLGYLFYMKMKDNMHWPFDSEKPLTMETLRVGLSLTF